MINIHAGEEIREWNTAPRPGKTLVLAKFPVAFILTTLVYFWYQIITFDINIIIIMYLTTDCVFYTYFLTWWLYVAYLSLFILFPFIIYFYCFLFSSLITTKPTNKQIMLMKYYINTIGFVFLNCTFCVSLPSPYLFQSIQTYSSIYLASRNIM